MYEIVQQRRKQSLLCMIYLGIIYRHFIIWEKEETAFDYKRVIKRVCVPEDLLLKLESRYSTFHTYFHADFKNFISFQD